MRQQFFIFIKFKVGYAYEVGRSLSDMQLPYCSEISLVSGEWDVLVRSECDSDADVGRILVTPVQMHPHVRQTKTEIGYPIFDPEDVFF